MPLQFSQRRLEAPLPVHVLTGFLGSGKTTVLRHLLQSSGMEKAAVVINEFGEVGLDHLLVGRIDAATVLLENGCICCSLRDDLAHTLRQLLVRRASGETPAFDRIIIETTGLAEPGAIVRCLLADQLLFDSCRLGGISATFDAVNGPATLAGYAEARRQIAIADRILVTKSDLVSPERLAEVIGEVAALNPTAAMPIVTNGIAGLQEVFSPLYDPHRASLDVRGWLASACLEGSCSHAHHVKLRWVPPGGGTHGNIRAFCLELPEAPDWPTMAISLRHMLGAHGARLLRVKGLLAIAGKPNPVVVHAVQGLVHPPVELEQWPDDDRRSQLVFVVDGVDRRDVEASLGIEPADEIRERPTRAEDSGGARRTT